MIVSIVSYRGGSGKSVFSVNFANALATNVLLVEADFLAPSLHYIPRKTKEYWNDYVLGKTNNIEALKHRIENFDLICTKPHDPNMISILMDREAWGSYISDNISRFFGMEEDKYDFVLIDNQSGTFYATLLHSFFSDFLICILRPDRRDVISTLEYLKILKKPFYIVWNQVIMPEKMDPVIKNWTETLFKPLSIYRGTLGKLPLDEQTAFQLWVEGTVLIKETAYHKSLQRIAQTFKQITQKN